MQRLDKLLVDQQHAATRTQAQKLIEAGLVEVREAGAWQVVKKASLKLPASAELRVGEHPDMKYVSRAGLKLEAVLQHIQLDVTGMVAVDIGQSTGGFTDCLLKRGAEQVVGIEVGHDQLAHALREDERVVCLEGVNARHLENEALEYVEQGFDLAVMDVSFISQKLILPRIPLQLKNGGRLITLIKPQFEVGPENLGKGGIVRGQRLLASLQQEFTSIVEQLGFIVEYYCESPIKGGDGNREYLLVATLKGNNKLSG